MLERPFLPQTEVVVSTACICLNRKAQAGTSSALAEGFSFGGGAFGLFNFIFFFTHTENTIQIIIDMLSLTFDCKIYFCYL